MLGGDIPNDRNYAITVTVHSIYLYRSFADVVLDIPPRARRADPSN